jgi:hypothetical protein
VWRLNKALYGLKQAPAAWEAELSRVLVEKMGFRRLDSEHGIYIRGTGNDLIILAVYVDDIVIAHRCSKPDIEAGFLTEFRSHFDIKDVGDLKFCLGIRVEQDADSGSVTLSMPAYVEELLDKVNMSGVNGKDTPFPPGLVLRKEDMPVTPEDVSAMACEPYCSYRSIVGALLYLAGAVRPDIAYAVNTLARYCANPGRRHWDALVHLLKYLKKTAGFVITYHGGRLQQSVLGSEQQDRRVPSLRNGGVPNPTLVSESYCNNLTAFADSDFAGDVNTRCSTSGWVLMMNGGPVAWRSHLQKSVSTSTTEAELYSLSDCLKEIIFMQRVLAELGWSQPRIRGGRAISNSGTAVFEDNKGCRDTSQNNGYVSGRAKHIDIRRNFVLSQVALGVICVCECSTDDMVADLLTKAVTKEVHLKLRDRLMGCPPRL